MICAYVPFWGPIMRCSRGVGSLKHRSGLSSRWGLGFNLCFGVEAGVCLRAQGAWSLRRISQISTLQ